MVRGKGALVWDVNGKEYIDANAGLWLSNIGHGRAEVAEVAKKRMETLEYFQLFSGYSNIPAIELATRVTELAPPGLTASSSPRADQSPWIPP